MTRQKAISGLLDDCEDLGRDTVNLQRPLIVCGFTAGGVHCFSRYVAERKPSDFYLSDAPFAH